MSIESVMPSNHLILCRPLLMPSVFPSIRVFSSELALRIRWPKHWSFSFSISPSNEYSGLISFRIDWFDLLAVQGIFKTLLQHHNSKASIFWCSNGKHLILHVVTIETLLRKRNRQVFPGGPMLNNLPANAGDMGLIPASELRSHMLWSNQT